MHMVVLQMNFICMLVAWTLPIILSQETHNHREYEEGHQFPTGSEHLHFPPTVTFSVYMGKMSYPWLPLLFESMRWNGPLVEFVIINVIKEGSNDAEEIIRLKESHAVINLHIVVLTIAEFSKLVHEKLGITVNMAPDWYYKLCDFKPVLAYLFPEYASEDKFKYWGYGDNDVIWGNFSRYTHWFNGDPKSPFIISGWFGTTGAGAWYLNTEATRSLFKEDELYVPLLANHSYHNLDEGGTQVDPKNVIDNGLHSISEIQKRHITRIQGTFNRAAIWKDHCFIDQGDSNDWAGPVRWFRGSLQIIHGSPEFPPGRELLFYHRPQKSLDFPEQLKADIFEDMMTYGFLLPNWVPVLTRYMCRKAGVSQKSAMQTMDAYEPFRTDCFGRGGKHRHSLDGPPTL